jgi:glycosyltransferase involved in cell wall biosynthesis
LLEFPKISIITPCLNRVHFIAEAIESVCHQDYPHIEHIVVDGGSTDGTLDILQRYHHLRVISEPDQGMYDAINKGIELSQGDVIGFLNTDDLYEPKIFGSVIQAFQDQPYVAAVMGGASVFRISRNGDKQITVTYPPIPENDLVKWLTTVGGLFNAWFFRRDLFDRLGKFNSTYQIAADREFLLRLAIIKVRYYCIEKGLYLYRRHTDSLTFGGQEQWTTAAGDEDLRIARSYLEYPNLSADLRHQLKNWHTLRSAELTVVSLQRLAIRQVFHYIVQGWRSDIFWPWALARSVFVKFLHIRGLRSHLSNAE